MWSEFSDFLDRSDMVNAYRNRRELQQSKESELSSRMSSSQLLRLEPEPMTGAYEGIMGIFDDPRMEGRRQFCSKIIENE